ncbi:MAG: antibiotic biosynthesis monooxygenase [Bacteroidetes bacterium]|nr:antibiotic biosynthesis monooxygenase [Bacteroidota bacterium]
MKPIHVFAKWTVKEGQLGVVLGLLEEVVEESVAEEGNLFYTVHQSNAEPNTLVLYEGYKDEDSVAAHRESEHFQRLVIGKIVPLLEGREVILATRVMGLD